jgi:hypothetical protein
MPASARRTPFPQVAPTWSESSIADYTASLVAGSYADLRAAHKVFVDLACSSHNAMWERNHLLLFRAALEWLTKGTVNGLDSGAVKLGY